MKSREAAILERFRREFTGTCDFCISPGGIWSDKDERKPVGRVYIGKGLLKGLEDSSEAFLKVLMELTDRPVGTEKPCVTEEGYSRGLFVDATYTLGNNVWIFEIKSVLKRKEAFLVGAQAWLYREIYKWEHPDKKIAAWILTTKFVGNRLYRQVFLDLYVEKLSLTLFLLDEGTMMGLPNYFR